MVASQYLSIPRDQYNSLVPDKICGVLDNGRTA